MFRSAFSGRASWGRDRDPHKDPLCCEFSKNITRSMKEFRERARSQGYDLPSTGMMQAATNECASAVGADDERSLTVDGADQAPFPKFPRGAPHGQVGHPVLVGELTFRRQALARFEVAAFDAGLHVVGD